MSGAARGSSWIYRRAEQHVSPHWQHPTWHEPAPATSPIHPSIHRATPLPHRTAPRAYVRPAACTLPCPHCQCIALLVLVLICDVCDTADLT